MSQKLAGRGLSSDGDLFLCKKNLRSRSLFVVVFFLLLRQEPGDSSTFKIVLDDRDPTEVQHNAVFFFFFPLQNDRQLSALLNNTVFCCFILKDSQQMFKWKLKHPRIYKTSFATISASNYPSLTLPSLASALYL